MLEKFGDNRSLVANVCPGFYTPLKNKYRLLCKEAHPGIFVSRRGEGERAQLFRWEVGIVQLLLLFFPEGGQRSGPPAHPHPCPHLDRCVSMLPTPTPAPIWTGAYQCLHKTKILKWNYPIVLYPYYLLQTQIKWIF